MSAVSSSQKQGILMLRMRKSFIFFFPRWCTGAPCCSPVSQTTGERRGEQRWDQWGHRRGCGASSPRVRCAARCWELHTVINTPLIGFTGAGAKVQRLQQGKGPRALLISPTAARHGRCLLIFTKSSLPVAFMCPHPKYQSRACPAGMQGAAPPEAALTPPRASVLPALHVGSGLTPERHHEPPLPTSCLQLSAEPWAPQTQTSLILHTRAQWCCARGAAGARVPARVRAPNRAKFGSHL